MKESVRGSPRAPAPDPEAIAAFAGVVFDYAEGLVPIRRLSEKGTPRRPVRTDFAPADDALGAVLLREAEAAARDGMGLFVIPGTVLRAGRAGAADVVQMTSVLVDLDTGDVAAKRDHLIAHLGPPSLEVASGGATEEGAAKLHLYWRLSEAATGGDIAKVCNLRRIIAERAGGDAAFARASQPIRVAGSVHAKHGVKAPVRIIGRYEREYDLAELTDAVAMLPLLRDAQRVLGCNRPVRPSPIDLMTRPLREGGADGVTRYDGLTKVIGHWLRKVRLGWVSTETAWEAVSDHNATLIQPPWPLDRLRREFDAILALDRRNHGRVPGTETADGVEMPDPVPHSEDALAVAFSAAHANRWKFVMVWAGGPNGPGRTGRWMPQAA